MGLVYKKSHEIRREFLQCMVFLYIEKETKKVLIFNLPTAEFQQINQSKLFEFLLTTI
jgi:hypothetical protein